MTSPPAKQEPDFFEPGSFLRHVLGEENMGLIPTEWSVVIVGRWNRAIFTPAQIARHVFEEDSKQVAVLVPLDGASPLVVRNPDEDVSVMTDERRLFIRAEKTTYGCLEKALSYGVKALDWLPHTPVSAAGFNVNYQSSDPSPELAKLIAADVDKQLSKVKRKIVSRFVGRSFEFGSGQIKLGLAVEDEAFKVLANFHRDSTTVEHLKEWLSTPIADIQGAIKEFLHVFDLHIEEPRDASDGQ